MFDSDIYAFPKLGGYECGGLRLGGGGLGNILFPFARCALASKRMNLKRINPSWSALHVGPFLRGERDSRFYGNLFSNTFGISGVRKSMIMRLGQWVREKDISDLEIRLKSVRPKVVVFEGLGNLFNDILRDHRQILGEILAISLPENTAHLTEFDGRGIGVHVRMGDFGRAPVDGARLEMHSNRRVPLEWYVAMIRAIRAHACWDLPVHLFSDGHDDELREVLSLPNVNRRVFNSSLADLLALSRCGLLIGSSGSTFSMWASYFGRMPVIWYPRLNAPKLYSQSERFEGDLPLGDSLPEKLRVDIKSMLQDVN